MHLHFLSVVYWGIYAITGLISMNEIKTLDAMNKIAEASRTILASRNEERPKLPRTFNRKEVATYLKSDARTVERVAEELGINFKAYADEGIPWIMTIDQVYAVRDALPETTLLKKKNKKFVRSTHQKCQIINIQNQKGGVGKTLTTITYATGLATECHEQYRVLVLDMDGQSTLSSYQPSVDGSERVTIGKLIQLDPESDGYANYIKASVSDTTVPNLKIIPADQVDRTVESIFHEEVLSGSMKSPYTRLASVIEALQDDFDIILIDTPPSFGYASINAYYAGTSVVFPLGANQNDTDATFQYFTYIPDLYTKLIALGHKGYDFINLLITNNEDNSNSSLDVIKELQSEFGEWLFANKFNRSEAVRVCSFYKNSVFDLSKSSYEGHKNTFITAQTNASAVLGELERNIKRVWGE